MVFKIAQNVAKYLGYFSKKICWRELSKIAQSDLWQEDLLILDVHWRKYFKKSWDDLFWKFNILKLSFKEGWNDENSSFDTFQI